jgi:hypothetical protein
MNQAKTALPDEKLEIVDKFAMGEQCWLLLANTKKQTKQQVSVDWITRRYEGVFAAVLPAYMSYDPSDGPVEHSIIEVINDKFVRLISESELELLVPHIQAEIVGRRIWSREKQERTLADDIEKFLGRFEYR